MIVSMNTVIAFSNEFIIQNISVEEKSELFESTNVSFDKLNISSPVIFNEIGEYIKYKIELKNDSNIEYRIKEINDNYDGNILNIKYDYDSGNIAPNSNFIIYITLKYENALDENELEMVNNIIVNIKLEDLNYKEEVNVEVDIKEEIKDNKDNQIQNHTEEIPETPETTDNIIKIISILMCSIFLLFIIFKKRKELLFMSFIVILFIAKDAIALNEKQLKLEFNNIIINNSPNRFKDFDNDDLGITKDKIANIYFYEASELPSNLQESYDISVFDNEYINTYYDQNGEMYDLYIVSNDNDSRYYSNNMSSLFSNLENVQTIDLSNLELS